MTKTPSCPCLSGGECLVNLIGVADMGHLWLPVGDGLLRHIKIVARVASAKHVRKEEYRFGVEVNTSEVKVRFFL
jgi:hypothetical protein